MAFIEINERSNTPRIYSSFHFEFTASLGIS